MASASASAAAAAADVKKPSEAKKPVSPATQQRQKMWEKKFGSKTAFNKKEIEYRKCVAAWLDQDHPKEDPRWESIVRNFTHLRVGFEILNPGEPLKAQFTSALLTKFPDGHKARVKKTFERNRDEFLSAATALLKTEKGELRSTVPSEEKCPKRKALVPKEKPSGEVPKAKASAEVPKAKPSEPKAKASVESPKVKAKLGSSPKISAELAKQLGLDLTFLKGRHRTNVDAVEAAEKVEFAKEKRADELALAAAAAASEAAQAADNTVAVKSAVAAIEAVVPSGSKSPGSSKNKAAASAPEYVGSEGKAKKLERVAAEAAATSGSRSSAERRAQAERDKEEKKAPAAAIDDVYAKYTDTMIAYTPERDAETKQLKYHPLAKRTDRNPNDKFVLDHNSLQSLIENKNQSFLTRVHRNLTALMKWQLEKYDDLIEKKAGSEVKLEQYKIRAVEDKEEKKKRQEKIRSGEEDEGDASEDYIIALIQKRNLLDKKIIPFPKASLDKDGNPKPGATRELKWSLAALEKRFLNAITNKKRGIMSISGDARKSVRDQLLRTIYSLSINIARFTEGENLILTGPAGSGKSTVADVIGYVYSQIGIMPTKYFADVPITGIVAPYVGGTAIKTQRKISEALGGTIFFDEFYRLSPECSRVRGGARSPRRNAEAKVGGAISDFGIEAINQLVAMLAEIKGLIVVIVAGYAPEMACVISSNEGLERRFVNQIDLNAFDAKDFTKIFANKVRSALAYQGGGLTIREDATRYISAVFQKLIDLGAMQNQAGDVDLISNYFATALGESDLDGLSWNNYGTNDDLLILSRAFNRFAERKGLKLRFQSPDARRSGGTSSPFPFRMGGNARFAPRIHRLLH